MATVTSRWCANSLTKVASDKVIEACGSSINAMGPLVIVRHHCDRCRHRQKFIVVDVVVNSLASWLVDGCRSIGRWSFFWVALEECYRGRRVSRPTTWRLGDRLTLVLHNWTVPVTSLCAREESSGSSVGGAMLLATPSWPRQPLLLTPSIICAASPGKPLPYSILELGSRYIYLT